MIVYEAKLEGIDSQCRKLDEALRTGLFVRNACLRYWIDGHAKTRNDLSAYCKVLSDNPDFPWVRKLNSMARQAMSERTWAAISRFFDNCKAKKPGKKTPGATTGGTPATHWLGYPKFKRLQTNLSVEYKTTGWKLSEDRRFITFTDGFDAGQFKLWGTRNLHFYQISQIKRVRVVRRADGYYAQFCIEHDRREKREPTFKTVGVDVGLNHFYTDSNGETVANPRHLRKSEKSLKRLQRRLSKTKKSSKNRTKFRKKLARKHLKVSRQRNPLNIDK